ncbi:MAG: hypothetical protein DHS20C06_08040 [Hyphobacterium sp.]|nr:MAG: hypothetical protein DHS20C06_08040 [Hyphobacterium sp.]
MKLKLAFGIIPAAALLLAACEQDGPLEEAGEDLDEAVENVEDAADGDRR